MEFQPEKMACGTDNPSRWVATGETYKYTIACYIWRSGGRFSEAIKAREPYFRAYSYPGGMNVDDIDHGSLEAAIAACEKHLPSSPLASARVTGTVVAYFEDPRLYGQYTEVDMKNDPTIGEIRRALAAYPKAREQLPLLQTCITERWTPVVNKGVSMHSTSCALCDEYKFDCTKCVIGMATQQEDCYGTPYYDLGNDKPARMLAFLQRVEKVLLGKRGMAARTIDKVRNTLRRFAPRAFFLKRKARKHYTAYLNLMESYDCGTALIDELTGGKLGHHRNMFNTVMDQLFIIDPTTPKGRL